MKTVYRMDTVNREIFSEEIEALLISGQDEWIGDTEKTLYISYPNNEMVTFKVISKNGDVLMNDTVYNGDFVDYVLIPKAVGLFD